MSRRPPPYDHRPSPPVPLARRNGRGVRGEGLYRFTALVGGAPARVFSGDGWRTGRLLAFALLLVFLGLGYWLLNAPNFGINRISVTGSRYLSPDMVDATTNVMHQNIFTLREQPIVDDLKRLPFVLDVRISRELPNSLRVDVTERQRKLIWRSKGVDYLVDLDGVVLEIAAAPPTPVGTPTIAGGTPLVGGATRPDASPSPLAGSTPLVGGATRPNASPSPLAGSTPLVGGATRPDISPTPGTTSSPDMANAVVVEAINSPPLKVGDTVESAVAVQSAQDMATKLPAYGVAYSRIEYATATGLTVVGPTGAWRAIFGSSADFDRKISVLKALTATGQKWTTLDLRFPTRPAFS